VQGKTINFALRALIQSDERIFIARGNTLHQVRVTAVRGYRCHPRLSPSSFWMLKIIPAAREKKVQLFDNYMEKMPKGWLR